MISPSAPRKFAYAIGELRGAALAYALGDNAKLEKNMLHNLDLLCEIEDYVQQLEVRGPFGGSTSCHFWIVRVDRIGRKVPDVVYFSNYKAAKDYEREESTRDSVRGVVISDAVLFNTAAEAAIAR